MSVISSADKYLDNSLEALMDLKTGITVYFINSEEVDLNVIAETHICMYIILNTLGIFIISLLSSINSIVIFLPLSLSIAINLDIYFQCENL